MDKPLSNRPIEHAPLLTAREATRCPMRTHLDIDPPPGVPVEVPIPLATRRRMEAGSAFEVQVMAELEQVLGPIPSFAGDPEGAATAMAEGVPVLAQVPLTDAVGRRTGRPDLLVATGLVNDGGRTVYVPVDIKAHLVTQDRSKGGFGHLRGVELSGLAGPLDPAGLPVDEARWARRNTDDLLILAHYHRLLEAAGHAGAEGAWGGIIGSDRVCAFHDLTAKKLSSWRNTKGKWSTLEKYDREFGFRLDVASLAAQRRDGLTEEAPSVVPARNGDCPTCHHRLWCDPQMEAADDLSLLPGMQWDYRHRLHEEFGVTTRAELAAADQEDMPTKTLKNAVDDARVIRAEVGAARRRGVTALDLPRADVEVDVDMESTPDGRVYLWGACVDGEYHPFADLSGEAFDDTALFVRFWDWLMGLGDSVVESGRTFAAYCWSGPSAENRYLRVYGPKAGVDVEGFIASAEWIDLEAVVKAHLVTGTGTSIKTIAPLAGFEWRDEDPGGDQSMVWWAEAVAGDRAAADRLLDYNADDVLAQAAIRGWLADAWEGLPRVEDL